MAIDGCFTGVGGKITSANATLKFTGDANNDYGVVSIGGLERSVLVIDDSDLGIAAGAAEQYCPGDLVQLSPVSVEVKLHMDNTVTRFPTAATGAAGQQNPVPLGVASGTSSTFVIEFPSTEANGAKLNFSGFFMGDSGIPLTKGDRLRGTFRIQPDGQHYSWTAATA